MNNAPYKHRTSNKSNGHSPATRVRFAGATERNGERRPVLITGGAGFIGTNVAHRLLTAGKRVLIYDNLCRPGVELNLQWLRQHHGQALEFQSGDVRDYDLLRKAVRRAAQIYHFAAQVAVTTSLDQPFEDFEINARGTLNLLEAVRQRVDPPPLLFTSTNKVYGDLSDVKLRMRHGRYEPESAAIRQHGFGEQRPLHFHSPYGCSKGAACQYVLDYARTFRLPTAVFRMSCIYGPHQFGTEDQGWVAHFLINSLDRRPITIYGDGRQVRDILFVEDLVDAMIATQDNIDQLQGQVFNVGGGPTNTTSLLELIDLIGELHGKRPIVRYEDWRPADQQYYVSDTRKLSSATGWHPKVDVRHGVATLYQWLREFHQPAPANGRIVRVPRKPGPGQVTRVRALRLKTMHNPRPIRGWKGGLRRPVSEPDGLDATSRSGQKLAKAV
ncbi:MAG TPA: SDR family NAD(P)-dependent oxidoreductase [Clostridia bacterium]|nr:SDR family NAD(P)-dependent oxidoreductase [Clostridia bacterium]